MFICFLAMDRQQKSQNEKDFRICVSSPTKDQGHILQQTKTYTGRNSVG